MPPAHNFDFYFPSRPSNSSARAEDPQLGGKGDVTKPQRLEENNHHMKPGNSLKEPVFIFKGSTDKKEKFITPAPKSHLRGVHILDRGSRERFLLAIHQAPPDRLRQAFQAFVSSVGNIPEGIYQLLIGTENAGRPQVPQQSVQSAGEEPTHRQRQGGVAPDGGPGVTNARAHLQVPGPGKVNTGAHPKPDGDVPGAAPYVRLSSQSLYHWPVQYMPQPQPQPQRLAYVPPRDLQHNPAPELSSRFRAVNLPYQAMGLPAHAPHGAYRARNALGQAFATQAIGRTQYTYTYTYTFTNRYGGT